MSPTRRALLRAGVGLVASAVAGCASPGGSNVSYPSTTARRTTTAPTTTRQNATTASETTADPTTKEPTTEATTTTPVEAANTALADGTANVVEEVVWFATTYEDAIQSYRTAVGRVKNVVGGIRSSSSVTENDLRQLDSRLQQLATVVEERLQPHFPGVDPKLMDPDNVYVENVRQFARYGDWDRVQEELDDMFAYYLAAGQDNYVQQNFSPDPIQGTLLGYLTATDGDESVLFELGYPSIRYGAFAYHGEDRHPTDDPVGSLDRNRLGSLFEAFSVAGGRRDLTYVVPHLLDGSFEHASTDDLRSVPVHVQRFVDDRAAADAVVSVLDGPVVQEGTETLGGTEWRRVYYYHEGDIEYAYLVRAGPFLLATGPSRTAWEERSENWSEPLERAWLWDG